jgi:hypothetical protein
MIVVLNSEQVANLLERSPEQILDALRVVIEKWQYRRAAELATYPPKTGGTYRRTGTLGRTWTTARPAWKATSNSFFSSIGNATPYAPLVQGTQQLPRNRRWLTVDTAATRAASALEFEAQQAIGRLASAINKESA